MDTDKQRFAKICIESSRESIIIGMFQTYSAYSNGRERSVLGRVYQAIKLADFHVSLKFFVTTVGPITKKSGFPLS